MERKELTGIPADVVTSYQHWSVDSDRLAKQILSGDVGTPNPTFINYAGACAAHNLDVIETTSRIAGALGV